MLTFHICIRVRKEVKAEEKCNRHSYGNSLGSPIKNTQINTGEY